MTADATRDLPVGLITRRSRVQIPPPLPHNRRSEGLTARRGPRVKRVSNLRVREVIRDVPEGTLSPKQHGALDAAANVLLDQFFANVGHLEAGGEAVRGKIHSAIRSGIAVARC